jgi:hypothetical protein
VIDARELLYINYLDRCRDCGKEYTVRLVIRHDCGCYLERPPFAQTPSLWREFIGLFRKNK